MFNETNPELRQESEDDESDSSEMKSDADSSEIKSDADNNEEADKKKDRKDRLKDKFDAEFDETNEPYNKLKAQMEQQSNVRNFNKTIFNLVKQKRVR